MEFKYIAVNGDNVGDSIGNAIATDNHEELSKITGGLKSAHAALEEWVASVGGETVTSSGDEGIYKVPADSFDEATIEGLRNQYSESAGTTLTIGIGDSMSEASKALIYGKLNDKDQVVEYDSHIDDYIASHDEDSDMEMPEGTEEGGAEDDLEAAGEEVADRDNGESDEQYQEGTPEDEESAIEGESPAEETDESEADISIPADEMVDEHEELVDTLESPSHEDDLEAAKEQSDELEQYQDIEESGQDADLGEDETIAEEGEMSEDDLDMQPEDKLDEVVGEDIDGDGDIDAIAASDDTMADEEGSLPEEMEMEDQAEEGVADNQDAVADMIHANMEGEDDMEDEASDEELRQDIVASLQTFKENKPMLEQAKTQNPKLYEALILTLRSMIEMAKKLNMNPMADAESQEEQDALPDADMVPQDEDENEFDPEQTDQTMADEEVEDEDEDESEDKEEEEDFKNNFKKSEMTKLYGDLMKAMKVLEKASKKK